LSRKKPSPPTPLPKGEGSNFWTTAKLGGAWSGAGRWVLGRSSYESAYRRIGLMRGIIASNASLHKLLGVLGLRVTGRDLSVARRRRMKRQFLLRQSNQFQRPGQPLFHGICFNPNARNKFLVIIETYNYQNLKQLVE
jgi:hypothetical protein